MIAPELEMGPIARRGMSAEELEMRRYAASELKGHPRCLLFGFVKRRGDRRKVAKIAKDQEPEQLPSTAPAQA